MASADADASGAKRRVYYGAARNMYEGAEVQRLVRRATQYEMSDTINPLANFVVHGRFYAFAPRSVGVFDETSLFRQLVVWLVTWRWWERFVLAVIIANSIILAMTDYNINSIDFVTMQPTADRSAINAFVEDVEPFFTVVFTLEAALKVVAMGFFVDRGAYLRDAWNVLDFVVVLTSILQILPGVPKISVLRAFRVLRPLRTLSRLKGMRQMVNSLLAAIPQLANVGLLLGFLFAVWGILGLNLFSGVLHARCRVVPGPVNIPASHLQPWHPSNTPPWVTAGDFEGVLAGEAGAVLNGSSLPPGTRQPLYFEMMSRYFSGDDADNSLDDNSTVVWEAQETHYVTFAQALWYVHSIAFNRTAFPWCGAGELVDPAASSTARWGLDGIPLSAPDWKQNTSPWQIARQCVWVVDDDDTSTCSAGGGGAYTCADAGVDAAALPSHVQNDSADAALLLALRRSPRRCGSNYDDFGNARFSDARVMSSETGALESIFNADNMGSMALTIFQVLTLEGWSATMYSFQDAYQPAVAALYFVALTLVGSLFLLNLVVASVFLNFNAAQVNEQEAVRVRKERIAEIERAEREESMRAAAKARLVSEVRTRAWVTKTNLRRVSQGDTPLSPGAQDAAAVADAMHAQQDVISPVASTPLPDPQPTGVLRRRLQRKMTGKGLSARNVISGAGVSSRQMQVGGGPLQADPVHIRESPAADGAASSHAHAALGSSVVPRDSVQAFLHRFTGPFSPSSNPDAPAVQGGSGGAPDQRRSAPLADDARSRAGSGLFARAASVRSTLSSLIMGARGSLHRAGSAMTLGSDALHAPTESLTRAASQTTLSSGALERVNLDFSIPPGTPLLPRIRLLVGTVVASGGFGFVMLLLILLNTATLAADAYPDAGMGHELEAVNFVLTIVFAMEMLGKMWVLGVRRYFADRFNTFDCLVVALSIVDLAVAPPYILTGTETRSSGVLALRTLRLTRIFKLARSWTSLRMLLRTVRDAVADVANFAVLLILYLFIFSLIGMQQFANRFRFDPQTGEPLVATDPRYFSDDVYVPRATFDNLYWSVLTVFQLVTLENWTDILISCQKVAGAIGVLYCVAAVVVGAFVLLSLFLAILLGHFEGLDDPNAVNPDEDKRATQANKPTTVQHERRLSGSQPGSAAPMSTGRLSGRGTPTQRSGGNASAVGEGHAAGTHSAAAGRLPAAELPRDASSAAFGTARTASAAPRQLSAAHEYPASRPPLGGSATPVGSRRASGVPTPADRLVTAASFFGTPAASNDVTEAMPEPHDRAGQTARTLRFAPSRDTLRSGHSLPSSKQSFTSGPQPASSQGTPASLGGGIGSSSGAGAAGPSVSASPFSSQHSADAIGTVQRMEFPGTMMPAIAESTVPDAASHARSRVSAALHSGRSGADASGSFHRAASVRTRRTAHTSHTGRSHGSSASRGSGGRARRAKQSRPSACAAIMLKLKLAAQRRYARLMAFLDSLRDAHAVRAVLDLRSTLGRRYGRRRGSTRDRVRVANDAASVVSAATPSTIGRRWSVATVGARVQAHADTPRFTPTGTQAPTTHRPDVAASTAGEAVHHGQGVQSVTSRLPSLGPPTARLGVRSILKSVTPSGRNLISNRLDHASPSGSQDVAALPGAAIPGHDTVHVPRSPSAMSSEPRAGQPGASRGLAGGPVTFAPPTGATAVHRLVPARADEPAPTARSASLPPGASWASKVLAPDAANRPLPRAGSVLPPSVIAADVTSTSTPPSMGAATLAARKLVRPAVPGLMLSGSSEVSSASSGSRSRGGQSDLTWLDRLSSFHDGDSMSSHGRGTVGSFGTTVSSGQSSAWEDGSDSEEDDLLLPSDRQDFAAHQTPRRGIRRACGLLLDCCCCWPEIVPDWACKLCRRASMPATDGPRKSKDRSGSRSLFCLLERHPLRRLCISIAQHPRFELAVLAVIVISSVALAVDNPLTDPASMTAQVLRHLDVALLVFFCVEMAIKVVANGLLLNDSAYLRSGWNWLDMIIVAISIFALATEGNAIYQSLRAARALRALRPLRVISRWPSLRLVVNALFRALKPIMNVMLVCSLVFLIFAIVFTSLFKGATSECTGSLVDVMGPPQLDLIMSPRPYVTLTPEQQSWGAQCNDTAACSYTPAVPPTAVPTAKDVCQWYRAEWTRVEPQNFDNVISAMGTLLQISTTEQWVNIMYMCIDARGVEAQPARNANPGFGMLFVVFMLFGAYFTVNLFIAAIVDETEKSREELGENNLLTEAQKEWVRMQEVLLMVKPKRRRPPPHDPTRRALFNIVTTEDFEQIILLLICVNTFGLAVQYFGMPQRFADGLEYLNDAMAAIFTIEALVRIYALGWRTYWESSWNRFDLLGSELILRKLVRSWMVVHAVRACAVVIASDVGILIAAFTASDAAAVATVARALRIGRVLRLAQSLKGLRQMVSALIITIPSLVNIGSLLALMLFIYAVAGVQLFARTKFGDTSDRHANFRDFGTAVLTLWRSVTGETWNGLMYDYAVTTDCDDNPPFNEPVPTGCGTTLSFAYFYSFIVINVFIIVQLLIAVVLEAFSDITDEDAAKLSRDELEKFAATWVQFDPECTLFMSTVKLRGFLAVLPPPMGFGVSYSPSAEEMTQLVASLRLPTYAGNYVHFSDVALACARRVIAAAVAERGDNFEDIPNTHVIAKRWEKLRGAAVTLQTDWTIQHFVAAEAISSTFRVFRFRRALAL